MPSVFCGKVATQGAPSRSAYHGSLECLTAFTLNKPKSMRPILDRFKPPAASDSRDTEFEEQERIEKAEAKYDSDKSEQTETD